MQIIFLTELCSFGVIGIKKSLKTSDGGWIFCQHFPGFYKKCVLDHFTLFHGYISKPAVHKLRPVRLYWYQREMK